MQYWSSIKYPCASAPISNTTKLQCFKTSVYINNKQVVIMDVVSAASDMRKLLVAHDNSNSQVSALDEYITGTSQRHFLSSLEGHQSQTLHLALRLSVSEGMQSMYSQYTNKKWTQVQEKARSITAALQSETEVEASLSPAPSQGRGKTDKAAGMWSSAFCAFYRDS